MIDVHIAQLVNYAQGRGLIDPSDRAWAVNRLLDVLRLDRFADPGVVSTEPLEDILSGILTWAVQTGRCEDSPAGRDMLDTALMSILTPRPSWVIQNFVARYDISPEVATDWYYKFSQDTNYIRRDRIKKDMKWVVQTDYGGLDITLNLSKPDWDTGTSAVPNAFRNFYPKCRLCAENEGYSGRAGYPARGNHRCIPLAVCHAPWYFQYSPYVDYNEHCILFSKDHVPMKTDRACFEKLLDFVDQFPHYFAGANADLPIVGGSVLKHGHFQGGRYTFAMERAPVEREVSFPGFEDVAAGIVKWPMSVIRLRCDRKERLAQLADRLLAAWRDYTDEKAFIFAETDGKAHNAITSAARRRGEDFELDLILRNNITTGEFPLGVYHPHPELHHIMKENIGLVEAMGLAVLPGSLKAELARLADALVTGKDVEADETIARHAAWAGALKARYTFTAGTARSILRDELGQVFARALECAGVYKRTDEGQAAFVRFLDSVK